MAGDVGRVRWYQRVERVRGREHGQISGAHLRLPEFYPILDTGLLGRLQLDPVEAAGALLEAGVTLLQWRHKGYFSREVFEQARMVAALCADAKALFIVNDRADMAALLEAGVHLGQDDLTVEDARKVLPPGSLCGLSTHNEEQLRDAARRPVDYVALGPVFGTISKENADPVLGLGELRRLRALTDRPLVAIGGITRGNATKLWEAGAGTLGVIGDAFPQEGGMRAIRARAEEWLTSGRRSREGNR